MGIEFLQIVLYVLGAVLLVALIVLIIKLIYSINRVNAILDNIERKVKTFDKAFNAVDRAVDSLSLVSDKVVDGISSVINKVFSHKKTKKDINNMKEDD